MADNNENILVEYDYDNITLIDPNRIIDDLGNVQERLVKQEDLVYYANLETFIVPRTKLAIGESLDIENTHSNFTHTHSNFTQPLLSEKSPRKTFSDKNPNVLSRSIGHSETRQIHETGSNQLDSPTRIHV